jgi:hypothetical protein
MKSTNPHSILAASYRRLASTFRIRVINYRRASKKFPALHHEAIGLRSRAKTASDLAEEFSHEARVLKAKGKQT